MNDIKKFYNQDVKLFSKAYASYISKIVTQLDFIAIEKLAKSLLKARKNNNQIFFAGNGGSSSTASHFVNDLGVDVLKANGLKKNTKSFRVFSLNDNIATITAISNDIGYEEVFSRQLEVYGKKNDVLVVISASGNSKNLIKVVKKAKEMKVLTIGLLGFDGGKLMKIIDIPIKTVTNNGEFGPTEDTHLIICHILANYFGQSFKSK